MWNVMAEESMRCRECFHEIPAGRLCLSQMPEHMPENFNRRKYENYCIHCPECSSKERRRALFEGSSIGTLQLRMQKKQ